jgi:hypothetical protein
MTMDNHTPVPRDTSPVQELSGSLREAVEQVRRQPVPEEALARALDEAERLSASSTTHRRRRRQRFALTTTSIAAAALVLLGVGLWLARPTVSWADVARAVQEKPWIHGTSKDRDGATREVWLSPTRGVSASRDPDEVRFFDQRLRVFYTYQPKDKVLLRVPDTFHTEQDEFQTLQQLFQDLEQTDTKLTAPVPHGQVVDQQRRRIVEDGRQWFEYSLTVRAGPGTQGPLGNLVFRVDPQTRLPASLKWKRLDGTPDHPAEEMTMQFDYPEQGPADVFDLGVPRTAKLDDRVPADDLERVLDGLRAGRDRFESYHAVVVRNAGRNEMALGEVMHLWRKGKRWRIENGNIDQGKIAVWKDSAQDLATWGRDNLDSFRWQTYEVCDGRAVYEVQFGPKGTKGPLQGEFKWREVLQPGYSAADAVMRSRYFVFFPDVFHAYPTLPVPSAHFVAQLDAHPKDGPPDTVMLTVRLTTPQAYSPEAYRWERYWLDPSRSYAVVRSERSLHFPEDAAGDKDSPDLVMVAEKMDRSPSGLWYPTLVSEKLRGADGKVSEQFYRFALDFKADFADNVFKPAPR